MAIKTFKRTVLLLPLATIIGCHSTGHHEVDGYTEAVAPTVALGEPQADLSDSPPMAPPYVEPTNWPGDTNGLVFSWADGAPVNIKKNGKAQINDAGIMEFNGGSISPSDFNDALLESCRQSNELSIEAVLMSSESKQTGPARIVSFSKDSDSRNFTLGQDGKHLVLRLRTSGNDDNGSKNVVKLTEIEKDRPLHLIVTHRKGQTVCYVDGQEVSKSDDSKGDFSNWEPMELILGDEVSKKKNWNGTIERIAIGSRFIDADAARRQFDLMMQDTTE